MANESSSSECYGSPSRLLFARDEAMHPWLSALLDAYFIADQGVAEGVARETKQGRTLACRKGCSACCRSHKAIPVYPSELVGLSWYATEKLHGPAREKLKEQLRLHGQGEPCPFLVDDVCAVHEMRPMACRHFNVFGRVCEEGEDAYYTRRQDVLTPIKRFMDDALDAMLPFYGITTKAERRKAVKTGALHQLARVMQELAWSTLAEKMDAYGARSTGGSPPR